MATNSKKADTDMNKNQSNTDAEGHLTVDVFKVDNNIVIKSP